MFKLFKQKAEVVNAEVYSFNNKTDVLNFIKDFIKQNISDEVSKSVVWCYSEFLEGIDLDSLKRNSLKLSLILVPILPTQLKLE